MFRYADTLVTVVSAVSGTVRRAETPRWSLRLYASVEVLTSWRSSGLSI